MCRENCCPSHCGKVHAGDARVHAPFVPKPDNPCGFGTPPPKLRAWGRLARPHGRSASSRAYRPPMEGVVRRSRTGGRQFPGRTIGKINSGQDAGSTPHGRLDWLPESGAAVSRAGGDRRLRAEVSTRTDHPGAPLGRSGEGVASPVVGDESRESAHLGRTDMAPRRTSTPRPGQRTIGTMPEVRSSSRRGDPESVAAPWARSGRSFASVRSPPGDTGRASWGSRRARHTPELAGQVPANLHHDCGRGRADDGVYRPLADLHEVHIFEASSSYLHEAFMPKGDHSRTRTHRLRPAPVDGRDSPTRADLACLKRPNTQDVDPDPACRPAAILDKHSGDIA